MRKRKWERITRFVGDVNVLIPHLLQFIQYEKKELIKFKREKNKHALFVKKKEEQEMTRKEKKETFMRFLGL